MEKTDNRIAETVLWLMFGIPASIIMIIASVCVGVAHGARFFFETVKEYASWLTGIWM